MRSTIFVYILCTYDLNAVLQGAIVNYRTLHTLSTHTREHFISRSFFFIAVMFEIVKKSQCLE